MAGIDILNQFPNSRMAAAVRLGQSRFITGEMTTTAAAAGTKSGSATLTGVAGNTSTAQLLTLCGLTSSFTYISLTPTTTTNGIIVSQGGNAVNYKVGQSATFSGVTTSANQLQVGTAAPDVVTVNYLGV